MQQFYSTDSRKFINRYLPYNFLAEKMILSCLLVNSEAIDLTLQTLSIDAFYFKNHQELYRAISFMYKKKFVIDAFTLITFLQSNGLLEKIGGVRILIELLNQTPNLFYLEEYLALVKEKFIRRSLIKIGYEIINSSYITNLSLEIILNKIENKLFNLTSEIKTQRLSSSAELLNDIFFELKTKSLNPVLSGLPSGFDELDTFTHGFQKSDLIIIAGRPSMGKTALSLNIVSNIMKHSKLPILFFSLEMSKEQIMYRFLSMETNINQMRLKSGRVYQNEWVKLHKMIKILSKLPFFIDDTFNLSPHNIKLKLKTIMFEQNQIGLIVIDYLQLMQDSKLKTENRAQELSKITRSLKTLAREFNIPIIALSQLSRSIEMRVDKKPILSDLRESGSIEQDADLVLMLSDNISQGLNQNQQLIELIVAKQRNGPTGIVRLKFNKNRTKFYSFNV